MTPPPAQTPRSVAVLHATGRVLRAVIADTTGSPPTVKAWREFPADDAAALEAWLDGHGPDEVIGILPASSVICRTCTLPDAPPETLVQALGLQAETHMPGAAPPHRLAVAVLPAAGGETNRSGIICAWPERTEPPLPECGRPITYCPDVASLAAILNSMRPGDPLIWLDSADGSVALALSHANGAVFRCARGGTESPGGWRESAARVLAETAISVNHTGAFTESLVGALGRAVDAMPAGTSALIGPEETITSARQRLAGTPDHRWWQDFGIAAGAVMARVNHMAALTRLERDAPIISPSRIQEVADRLSTPISAARIAVVCILLVIVAPLVAARMRLALLELRLPDLQKHVARARDDQARLAMYDALGSESWPMTKLLGDIACNTPEGIELDQIRIRHGQDVQVTGSSKGAGGRSAQDLIAQMQENFRASGLFVEITPTWTDPDTFKVYDFTLHADVIRPFKRVAYAIELDYGAWTFAERLYGDGKPPETRMVSQRGTPPEPPPDEVNRENPESQGEAMRGEDDRNTAPGDDPKQDRKDPQESGPVEVRVLNGARGGDSDVSRRGSVVDRGRDVVVPPSKDIPEPYSAEHIASMSRPEAMETWARLSKARQQGDIDDETRKRLKRDFDRVKVRVRELQSSESNTESADR